MPYPAADFDDLVKKVDDAEYRLAHIQVHDDLYLSLASLSKLFEPETIKPDHVLALAQLVAQKYRDMTTAK